jgi:hypothetical protein
MLGALKIVFSPLNPTFVNQPNPWVTLRALYALRALNSLKPEL